MQEKVLKLSVTEPVTYEIIPILRETVKKVQGTNGIFYWKNEVRVYDEAAYQKSLALAAEREQLKEHLAQIEREFVETFENLPRKAELEPEHGGSTEDE